MTRILAIETATEACSAALLIDGDVRERFELAPRKHAALLLPYTESLLQQAGLVLSQLDVVAFGRGPGSFTGLRIAAGVAQGLAFGAGLPVVPVSTLAALAQGTLRQQGAQKVLAALDARMQEIYWGAYACGDSGLVELVGKEQVCAPQQVHRPQGTAWVGAGSGWETYADELAAACALAPDDVISDQIPHAADVATLALGLFEQGKALPPEQAIPVYLRDKVAEKPKPRA
jgi:tRNA threonylcarbamoyladenosine biosynthesis protein TsaB